MNGKQFGEWRMREGFKRAGAARALGIGRRTIIRWEDEEPEKPIPLSVELACCAFTLGFRRYPDVPPVPVTTERERGKADEADSEDDD
ncbi:hypothetical protein ATO13_22511 [Stappia sp. 22II-S9-Z10]|nr:hypothetical protein ATO13_22511 [Stappia sp. 22II-S9-Z10]